MSVVVIALRTIGPMIRDNGCRTIHSVVDMARACLLYTSDAADE